MRHFLYLHVLKRVEYEKVPVVLQYILYTITSERNMYETIVITFLKMRQLKIIIFFVLVIVNQTSR